MTEREECIRDIREILEQARQDGYRALPAKAAADALRKALKILESGRDQARRSIGLLLDVCMERGRRIRELEALNQGLWSPSDVAVRLVEHGQKDPAFKIGETIRYSPTEVERILLAREDGQ